MKQVWRNLVLSCFCCHHLPSCSWVSTSSCTKAAYLAFYFSCLIIIIAAFYSPGASKNLPFCKGDDSLLCKHYSSFPAIYRICFTYILFFTVMCAFTFGVNSSRNYRSVIHNGFWFFKIAFIVVLLVGTAYIPHGLFDEVLMYFGLLFMVTFNVFQMFLYIQLVKDFTVIFRVYFLRQASACAKFIITFFALTLLGAGVGIFIVLYILYTNCTINLVFTIVNMSLSYLINVGSVFINLQKKEWNSIFGGSILTTHVMFLTWSAITNNPRDECNPTYDHARAFFIANNFTALAIAAITVVLAVEYFIRSVPKEKPNSVVYIEDRGNECCGIWGKRKLIQTIQPENTTSPPEGVTYTSTDPSDDEYDHIKYYWYAMHNLFLQIMFYFMIGFTKNYAYSENPPRQIFYNEAAMWFKIVSTWLCMLSFAFAELMPDSSRIFLTAHT